MNKQIHYNVKFLKGYGHSISVKDSKIILKDNHDPFSKSTTEEWFVKNMPYEKIVLQGRGYISTEALSLLSQNSRNVVLVDNHGKPTTFMNGMMDSLTATKYRMGQYDTFRDSSKCKYLASQIVKAKTKSQLKFLESTKQDVDTSFLQDLLESLENPLSKEAKISRGYFKEYPKLFDEKLGFTSRNQSFVRTSKNILIFNP